MKHPTITPQHIITLTTILITILTTLTTILNLPTQNTPQPTPQHTINQGDQIYLKNKNNQTTTCTIGYINHTTRTAYTAGHCADEPTTGQYDPATGTTPIIHKGYTGSTIHDPQTHTQLGTITTNNRNQNPPWNIGDWAEITINPNIKLGHNNHSGNHHANTNNIQPGDKICSYSSVHQQKHCGIVIRNQHAYIIATPQSAGTHGDSGGPAWIENPDGTSQGFYGVLSGHQGLVLFHKPHYTGPTPTHTQGVTQQEITTATTNHNTKYHTPQ